MKKKYLIPLWRTLGSVWLAVPVLTALGLVLGIATFYEARFGTAAVQRDVYQSFWFFLLQFFLVVNLAVAALRRWPWQKSHAGFVLVHAGIISMLVGGFIGTHFGEEGTLLIPEGSTQSEMQLNRWYLTVDQPNPGFHLEIPTAFEARPWIESPNQSFEVSTENQTYHLLVDRYFPDAVAQETVVEDPHGAPAVQLEVLPKSHLRSGPRPIWLWARDTERFSAHFGPIHLMFLEANTDKALRALLAKPKKVTVSGQGTLVFQFPWGKPHRVNVTKALKQPVALVGTPYRVRVRKYFTELAVTPEGVVNQSNRPKNPAVVYTLLGPDGEDTQMVLATDPDFFRTHGRAPAFPHRARLDHPVETTPLPANLVAVIKGPSGQLQSVVTDSNSKIIERKALSVGGTFEHPKLNVEIRLVQWIKTAARKVSYQAGASREVRFPVVRVQVEGPAGTESVWLPEGTQRLVSVGGHPLSLRYGSKRQHLPFSVTLLDFRKQLYPGTNMPAGFESEVELHDEERGVTLKQLIWMNEPLKYRGYSLFQSSYLEDPVEATVLSVRKDPGVPLVYIGFLTIVAGLVVMFYFKPRKVN